MKTFMNMRTRSSAAVVVALVAAAAALFVNLQACELITDFDRSLIPDAGDGEDATDFDVVTPPFDLDAGADAFTPVADASSDAGDATITDAASDADADAAPADASDASDADAADAADADAAD
jgi:hypothetical protein